MKYDLVGIDGNAFAIMGYVINAMKNEGYSKQDIEKYYTNATSSNYDHLLCVSVTMIDDINARAH